VQPRVHRAHAVHRHGAAQVVGDAVGARAGGDIEAHLRLKAHHRPGHLPAVGGGAVLPDHLGVGDVEHKPLAHVLALEPPALGVVPELHSTLVMPRRVSMLNTSITISATLSSYSCVILLSFYSFWLHSASKTSM